MYLMHLIRRYRLPEKVTMMDVDGDDERYLDLNEEDDESLMPESDEDWRRKSRKCALPSFASSPNLISYKTGLTYVLPVHTRALPRSDTRKFPF
jgi:hypothetical protein